MMQYAPCTLRPATQEDHSFIYNSWLKSFKDGSPWARYIPSRVYFDNHKLVIQKILKESHVLIACNPDCNEQIFGYGIAQPTMGRVAVIHYLYIKHSYRKLGIGSALMHELKRLCDHEVTLPCVTTHATMAFESFAAKKWNAIYNPYILGGDNDDEEDYMCEAI
jgi:ribosomal protein S18 acetylase RimI-like enzyme